MDYKNIYFIGIGGIGMSAIARYYKRKGFAVGGYDRTPSPLTRQLEAEGIAVHYEDNVDYIPLDVDHTMVVYTPAVPEELEELRYVRENGYPLVKRSRMLGEITAGQRCLAVAGTHGKTTTSTLTAHILTESEVGCSAFLGGISKNYGSNLLVGENDIVVAEADEFDRSFLQLHPEKAVITAMDPDHLDIYGTLEAYQQAFRDFASQVSKLLIVKAGLPLTSADTPAKITTYGIEEGDWHASNLRPDSLGHYTFDLVTPNGVVADIRVGVPGLLNVENSIAAAALCLESGVRPEELRKAIGSFAGVQRRMDVQVNKPGCTYIDDYAHHPAEIAATLHSIRSMFPGRKVTAIFQPHLYTRTRDFAPEFAKALSLADQVVLLPIYPAREEPIEGVTSELIFKDLTAPEKLLIEKEELMEWLGEEYTDVLVTFGAGNIDRYVTPIAEMLRDR